ncbi:TetR/AcrR family transcriptional regulator [Pseudonocardia humida]|uniref:TetR family transcriptional regulator n=1 Tax=Pseudonocardia humida TaxID=2800819 RepID=A0ABT1A0Z4_9PSEU|nr:TetR/AcrR family transcriptional regulator [Pseudonocardia humida]MCO1656564.1 TetR family transcriptional regulator [Pseudonocardia humida]
MSTEGAGFLRARRPEQKRLREASILDAARELALRDGVGSVSLAAIAADVGMHKSALLKYFGTREEIFLRLAETEWNEWAVATVAELDAAPSDEDRVVDVLTRSLADRPLFCQLLIHASLTLERNVSLDAVRRSKVAATGAAGAVSDALHRALPGLSRDNCFELLGATGLVSAGLWQMAHPPPVVVALYAEPGLSISLGEHSSAGFAASVARFIRVYLTGLRRTGD